MKNILHAGHFSVYKLQNTRRSGICTLGDSNWTLEKIHCVSIGVLKQIFWVHSWRFTELTGKRHCWPDLMLTVAWLWEGSWTCSWCSSPFLFLWLSDDKSTFRNRCSFPNGKLFNLSSHNKMSEEVIPRKLKPGVERKIQF